MEFVLTSAMEINLFVAIQLVRKRGAKELIFRIAAVLMTIWALRFLLLYLKLEPMNLPIPILIAFDQTFYVLDGLLVWLFTRSILE